MSRVDGGSRVEMQGGGGGEARWERDPKAATGTTHPL